MLRPTSPAPGQQPVALESVLDSALLHGWRQQRCRARVKHKFFTCAGARDLVQERGTCENRPMAICDPSLAVAPPGRSEPGLPPDRRRAIVDYAKASYVFDSVNNDPGLTNGIDNVLLLLLQFVLQVTDEGKTLPENIGLHAGDRLLERFRHCARLTRSVRRWLSEHTMLFVAIAEHMAEAMKQEDLPSPPCIPCMGFLATSRLRGRRSPTRSSFLSRQMMPVAKFTCSSAERETSHRARSRKAR